MARPITEWVDVNGDVSIIAREFGRGLVYTPDGSNEDTSPFATPMTGAGSTGSTLGLLDGAISLGFAEIEKNLAAPEPTHRRLCLGADRRLSHIGRHAAQSPARGAAFRATRQA